MKPILFVAYGGGHVAMLAPLADAVRDCGRPFTFLGLTTARAVLDSRGISSIGFADLIEAQDSEAQNWGIELAAGLPTNSVISAKESIAYLGANFRDLVSEHGTQKAYRLYSELGRQAFLPVETLRRFMQRLDPCLVVATNSPRAERASIIAAGQLGIPSVCAVDLFASHEVKWVGQAGFATKVCVLNESVRNTILSYGRDSLDVVVTGNPAFDSLTNPEIIHAGKKLRKIRGWGNGVKVILWASQAEPEHHPFVDRLGDPTLPRKVEQVLRQLVMADKSLRLVVRYHPSETLNFEPSPRVEFSPVSEPIPTLLHAVDVVVVTASTVGLEAALAGRRVVSVDTSIFTSDTQYAATGVSRGVSNLDDLGSAVYEALLGSGPSFCHRQTDKTATQQVLDVIESLLV